MKIIEFITELCSTAFMFCGIIIGICGIVCYKLSHDDEKLENISYEMNERVVDVATAIMNTCLIICIGAVISLIVLDGYMLFIGK